jgi:Zn-dependent peptidase ImmA (M78 family)
MNTATAAMHAHRSANKMLQSIWGGRGFPVDPVWIAGRLGVTVIEAELPASVLGALVKDQNKDPVIVINQLDEQTHKRFNCAHKIGHYADHMMNKDDFYKLLVLKDEQQDLDSDPIEIFANRFSFELLMPTDEIARLEGEGMSKAMMAEHFGVTEQVLQDWIENSDLCVE